MKEITVQREQLYKEAWSTPLSKLAPKYHISDVGLKKVCEKLNIPTPPRGYWAKLQYGKKVKCIPLPKQKEDQRDSWTFYLHPERSRQKKKKSKKNKTPVNLGIDIKVPQRLNSPHSLVRNTRKQLLNEKLDHCSRVKCTYSENCLDVYIGPDSIKRAMRILNALLKGFNKLGYRVFTKKEKFPRSFVLIDDQEVQFCMREKGYREKHIPTEEEKEYSWKRKTWDYFTNGELRLEIIGWGSWVLDQKKWSDKKRRPLEKQLNDFVAGVIRAAHIMKEEKKRREEERIKERKRQRKLDASRRQRNEELERLTLLEERAEHFTKSQYIYDFISEIEELESKLDLTEKERLKLKGWLHWSTMHADRLNPVKQTLKSIITDS